MGKVDPSDVMMIIRRVIDIASRKVDPSDVMMIIRRVIDIASRSPKFKWANWTHTTPHFAKKIRKVTKKTNYVLDTLSTEYTQAPGIVHRMCSMPMGKSA